MSLRYLVNDLTKLEEAIDLAKEVFKPSSDEIAKYHSRDDWLQRIRNDGYFIATAIKGTVVGFTVCDKREAKSLHIWNVGVAKKFRGMGIWKHMFMYTHEHAKSKEIKSLTLNTFPKKFPQMYNFVEAHGFVLEKEADKKSYFRLNIQ